MISKAIPPADLNGLTTAQIVSRFSRRAHTQILHGVAAKAMQREKDNTDAHSAGYASASWDGDWIIIATKPTRHIWVDRGKIYDEIIDETIGNAVNVIDTDPFMYLSNVMQERQEQQEQDVEHMPNAPHFVSGCLGYVQYDMAAYAQGPYHDKIKMPRNVYGFHDLHFAFYDGVIAIDKSNDDVVIFSTNERTVKELENATQDVVEQENIQCDVDLSYADDLYKDHININGKIRNQYQDKVAHIIDEILDGELFQANLTRMIGINSTSSIIDTAQFLSDKIFNSTYSSYAAQMNFDEGVLLSNSPERFFSIKSTGVSGKTPSNHEIYMSPIKGTAPRSNDPITDEKNATQLMQSAKDRAENIMIADLIRNDLSKICEDRGVITESLCDLTSFATVHHLVSHIRGVLKQNVHNAFDVLPAIFPCGSITGAPKLRAMQLIAELEKQGRGVYCGAMGFADDRGISVFSVPIRTMQIYNDPQNDQTQIAYGTGGGITTKSSPNDEFQETCDKAAFLTPLVENISNKNNQYKDKV